LLEARVSGVIATLTSAPLPQSLAMIARTPSVQLVRQIPGLVAPAVCMGDEMACQRSTEHLLALGHDRIGYIGTSETISTGADRLEGFIKAHSNRGLVPESLAIKLVPPRPGFGYAAVLDLLKLVPRPSASLIGSSELTIGGLRAIRESGLKMPDDISIIGYGDPVWFDLLSPPLTAVSLPVSDLADAAARELFMQLEVTQGDLPGAAMLTRIEPTLVERASTAGPGDGNRC
jgi:LacI family transcriptional regulator